MWAEIVVIEFFKYQGFWWVQKHFCKKSNYFNVMPVFCWVLNSHVFEIFIIQIFIDRNEKTKF